jgi:hypothetical protein
MEQHPLVALAFDLFSIEHRRDEPLHPRVQSRQQTFSAGFTLEHWNDQRLFFRGFEGRSTAENLHPNLLSTTAKLNLI